MTARHAAAGGSGPSADRLTYKKRAAMIRFMIGSPRASFGIQGLTARTSVMARIALALLLSLVIAIRPAAAQSVLRDAETEAFFREISEPIIRGAGLKPANVEILLVGDQSINAFTAGGQTVYINAGLIAEADTANEVQGVIAHELGHVVGGHAMRIGDGASTATGISIGSLLLGALATLAGAGDAGMGIMMAGQRAAMGKFLAYTRVQETVADSSGAEYLSKAGISGRGSIDFFKKLQSYEFRIGVPQDDDSEFVRSHPLSGNRIQFLKDIYEKDPAWETPLNPKWERDFQRVKAKLEGYMARPEETQRDYPESDQSVPAHYARAYAWHKAAYPQKAEAEARQLIASDPDDPYFHELYGQILLESGKPAAALGPLRKAVAGSDNNPLIAALLGHALVATEDRKNLAEAEDVLKSAVVRDNRNPFAWYQLGVVYEQRGDEARAALASAERDLMTGSPDLALRHSDRAMNGLPDFTPDWLRAQDIRLIAEAQLEDDKKRRR